MRNFKNPHGIHFMRGEAMFENAFTSPFYELHGRRELLIDGAVTLAEYSDAQIVLLCCGQKLRVRGKSLRVALLSMDKALINGNLDGLDFL